jgi:hypothetical protein
MSLTRPPNIVRNPEALLTQVLDAAYDKNINTLRAANQFVRQAQRKVRVRSSSFDASFRRVFRDVFGCEECVAILVLSGSRCEELSDKWHMRFCLRFNDPRVFTYSPMFDIEKVGCLDYIRVRDASCSMPLWRSRSAKSNVSLE